MNRLQIIRNIQQDLFNELLEVPSGAEWCIKYAEFWDILVREEFNYAASKHGVLNEFALIATGSYGRRETAPYSNLAVALIRPEGISQKTSLATIELRCLLYRIFTENLGIKTSIKLIQIGNLDTLDDIWQAALLCPYFICGNETLLEPFWDWFWSTIHFPTFSKLKAEQRKNGLAQCRELDVKEGAGGLRDFEMLLWNQRARNRPDPPEPQGYDYLLKVRNILQALAGKNTDVFTHVGSHVVAEKLHTTEDLLLSKIHAAMA